MKMHVICVGKKKNGMTVPNIAFTFRIQLNQARPMTHTPLAQVAEGIVHLVERNTQKKKILLLGEVYINYKTRSPLHPTDGTLSNK